MLRVRFPFHHPPLARRLQADRYRLNVPVRLSDEGPGYVSTDQAVPSCSNEERVPVEGGNRGARTTAEEQAEEREEGEEEEEEGAIEDGEMEDGELGGQQEQEQEKQEVHKQQDDEEDEEEEGAIGASTGASTSPAAASPVVLSGSKRSRGSDGSTSSGDDAGSCSRAPSNGGGVAAAAPSENGIMVPRAGGGDGNCRVVPDKEMFVPPAPERLCPIPSGPCKGAVMLGVDCEMVSDGARGPLLLLLLLCVRACVRACFLLFSLQVQFVRRSSSSPLPLFHPFPGWWLVLSRLRRATSMVFTQFPW